MKNFDYKGSYINKTNHHIYIAPTEELKDIIAHYTITFPSEVPKKTCKSASAIEIFRCAA